MRTTRAAQRLRLLLLAGALCLLSGCGEGNPLARQRVFGEITLNGTPLAKGTIAFSPAGQGVTSSGATIENGTFEIPAEKGLPPGEYFVRISAAADDGQVDELPGDSEVVAEELIPAEYNSQSTLKFTVNTDRENKFELDIKSP
jgi:hypothetical protein